MKKVFFIVFLLFSFIPFSFASSGELFSDKSEIGMNETIKVKALIDFDSENVSFKNIDLGNNFEVLSTSSFTNSSSNITIINGQQKTVSKNELSILFELKPLKTGEFQIGPANFEVSGKTVSTNTIKIKVVEKSNSSNNAEIEPTIDLNNIPGINNEETSEENSGQITNNTSNNNYKIFYYLLGILLLVLGLNIGVINRMKSGKKEEVDNTKNDIITPQSYKVYENETPEEIHTKFLMGLKDRYSINDIFTKTSKEILICVDNQNYDEVSEILNYFDNINYSNIKEKVNIEIINKINNLFS